MNDLFLPQLSKVGGYNVYTDFESVERVRGYLFEYKGLPFIIHRPTYTNNHWVVAEYQTGLNIPKIKDSTRLGLIRSVIEMVDRLGVDYFLSAIDRMQFHYSAN